MGWLCDTLGETFGVELFSLCFTISTEDIVMIGMMREKLVTLVDCEWEQFEMINCDGVLLKRRDRQRW